MKVKVIYRRYKALHDLYASFYLKPPHGVTFIIPNPHKGLRTLLHLHRRFGNTVLIRRLVWHVQDFLFEQPEDEADILHFAQLMPTRQPARPYVVDFEHIVSLANYACFSQEITNHLYRFLSHDDCGAVMPLSNAALNSLKHLLGDNAYDRIRGKCGVVYPALPNYAESLQSRVDGTHVRSNSDLLNLLFVGNDVYRKGLHELLSAFRVVATKYPGFRLFVISDAPKQLIRDNISDKITFFPSRFSHYDVITKFYLPCDLFVLPTHCDTFGMAYLYSLSSGTPVLTTQQFATEEIVRAGHNGFLVQSKRLYLNECPLPNRSTWDRFAQDKTIDTSLVDQLVDRLGYSYLNRDLLHKMGQQAVKDFNSGGRFSLEARNLRLGRAYRSCLGSLRS